MSLRKFSHGALDAVAATLDVGRYLRSAERGRGAQPWADSRSRVGREEDARLSRAALERCRSELLDSVAEKTTNSHRSSACDQRKPWTAPRRHSIVRRRAIVKDRASPTVCGGRRSRATSDLAGNSEKTIQNVGPTSPVPSEWTARRSRRLDVRFALDAVQTEFRSPESFGSRSVRVLVDGVAVSALWVWPAPNAAQSSGATRRETRDKVPRGTDQSVTLRLAR